MGDLGSSDVKNLIRIVMQSQGNPQKAIAEFVENSIDAKASYITAAAESAKEKLRFWSPMTVKGVSRAPTGPRI